MNYNNKKFKPTQNSENGEVTDELVFTYKQTENILTCEYSGEKIKQGQLIGIVKQNGTIQMSYHQVNLNNQIRTGICTSKPEILQNGKIVLVENWQWTNGDKSKGKSKLLEV